MVLSAAQCVSPWASAHGDACSLLPSSLQHPPRPSPSYWHLLSFPDLPHFVIPAETRHSQGNLNLREVDVVPRGVGDIGMHGSQKQGPLPRGSPAPLLLCLPRASTEF